MRIIVDCDSTVADFTGGILRTIGRTDRSVSNKWNWFMNAFPSKETEIIRNALNDHRWWSKLPILKDATKGIQWLRGQGHDLVWVTSPFKTCFGWCDARRDWLIRNFRIDQHNEPIVFTRDKYLVQADAIIDDMPEIVDTYGAHNPNSLCLTFKSELGSMTEREMVEWDDIMSMREFYYGSK